MYLNERDNRTDEMQALRPNGFTEETVISDFPVRDKKLTLHIRRPWRTPDKGYRINDYILKECRGLSCNCMNNNSNNS